MGTFSIDRVCAVLALICAAALSGCQSMSGLSKGASSPSARVTGVALHGLSLEKVDLVFDVEVGNPSDSPLPLRTLSYDIASSGQNLIKGHIEPNVTVPAHGTSTIHLPASIKFASLLGVLKGVRPGSLVAYTADFRVGTDAPFFGPTTVPVSYRGEIPVPAIPEVRLVSLHVGPLSFNQVDANLKLRVKNTNQFEIDLARLGINLALGGQNFGDTGQAQSLKLAPGETAVVEIPMSFSPRALGLGVFNMLLKRDAGYDVSGSLDVDTQFGPLTLPFSQQGETPIY